METNTWVQGAWVIRSEVCGDSFRIQLFSEQDAWKISVDSKGLSSDSERILSGSCPEDGKFVVDGDSIRWLLKSKGAASGQPVELLGSERGTRLDGQEGKAESFAAFRSAVSELAKARAALSEERQRSSSLKGLLTDANAKLARVAEEREKENRRMVDNFAALLNAKKRRIEELNQKQRMEDADGARSEQTPTTSNNATPSKAREEPPLKIQLHEALQDALKPEPAPPPKPAPHSSDEEVDVPRARRKRPATKSKPSDPRIPEQTPNSETKAPSFRRSTRSSTGKPAAASLIDEIQ